MISYDIYLFHYYSLEALLNKLMNLNIEIRKIHTRDKNNFYLKIKRKYRRIIEKNFDGYKIVDKLGMINFLDKLFYKPITCVSLLLSILLFLNLSVRIYRIDITGDYPLIEGEIRNFLRENNIYSFSLNGREENIRKVELKLKEKFNNQLEFIEVNKTGGVISLNYKKRRKEFLIEGKKGSLYASKDGVIRKFSLSSGVKNVKVNDFVKKGDLLVSDILVTTGNEDVLVGTLGNVYASTFYYIEVKIDTPNMDVASKQAYLLDMARNKVSKNINSDDEYIEKETILINDINKGYMRIYYVLYEDITI